MGPETAFASGSFHPNEFKQSEYGKNAMAMQNIYTNYEKEPMHPDVIKYWSSFGAKKELFKDEMHNGNGSYSVFTPLHMEQTKRYPVIYCSHGGGDNIFLAETYGYTELVGKEDIICIYAWNGDFGNSKIEQEFPRILQKLQDDGYPIDRSRVYAVGFSAGSVASVRLAMAHPAMLAGVAPVPGSNSFRGKSLAKELASYDKTFGYRLPIICAGGTKDGGDQWPLEEASYLKTFNIWMKLVAQANHYSPITLEQSKRLVRSSPDTVKQLFGLDFERTWINYLEGTYWYTGEFYTDEGYSIARFIGVDGLPHIHCRFLAVVIWNYLKQFSRNPETGELLFDKQEFNHAKNS